MQRGWNILLIGGSSGTGKTTLARQLSEHFSLPYFEVDDIRLVMQKVVRSEDYPGLFSFISADTSYFDTTPHEQLAGQLVKIGNDVWKGLSTVIDNHLSFNNLPVIIEGDGIIPDDVVTKNDPRIQSIFLHDSKEGIYEREAQREKAGHIRPWEVSGRDPKKIETWRQRYSSVSYLFGEILTQQAKKHGFPVFSSTPIDTLLERVRNSIKK